MLKSEKIKSRKKCKEEKIICIVTPRTQTVKLTQKEIKNGLTVYKYCHEKICEEIKSPHRRETGPGQGEQAYNSPVHIFS